MKDKEISKLIQREAKQQKEAIYLIPSENFVSEDVREALGSVFVNKYAEGYPGARYYGGNQVVDEVERLCQKRALKLFGLSSKKWSVNVQPYSGSPANLAVLTALLPQGETVMGLKLAAGGHLTHGHKVSATGKFWRSVQFDVDPQTEKLNYQTIRELALKEKPKVIIAGFTAYPFHINWKEFRKIADSVGAYFMVDMSHIAGLVAGKAYPSPFPYADVVTTTTHKTLRGPRAAMIFSKIDLSRLIDRAVFPGLQGGPHVNQVAAIAVALREADTPGFKKYAAQIVKNAQALSGALEKLGWRIVGGGTETHLLLVDVAARGVSGGEASTRLEKAGIIVNKNTIPNDPRPPMDPSGIRLGTPAATTRGMKEKDMKKIAEKIDKVLLK